VPKAPVSEAAADTVLVPLTFFAVVVVLLLDEPPELQLARTIPSVMRTAIGAYLVYLRMFDWSPCRDAAAS